MVSLPSCNMYQESLEAIRLLEEFQHPRVGKVCLIHLTGVSAQRWCLESGPASSHGSGSLLSLRPISTPRQNLLIVLPSFLPCRPPPQLPPTSIGICKMSARVLGGKRTPTARVPIWDHQDSRTQHSLCTIHM